MFEYRSHKRVNCGDLSSTLVSVGLTFVISLHFDANIATADNSALNAKKKPN